MRMSRRSLLAYDRMVGAAGDRAAAAYTRTLSLWLSGNPGATDNEVVDAAATIARTALGTYGASAAAAADELCRQLAAQEGVSGTTHTDYSPDMEEIGSILGSRKSRAPLARGDRSLFVALSSARVRDECHRAANRQMLRSAKALGCKRYARVPVGDSKTCAFCVSVAARGFHGLTEKGAERLAVLHDNCRCKVVPGFGEDPSVEGYDPGEYEAACELRQRLEKEGYSVAQIQRAMAGEPVESLGPPRSGKGGRPRKYVLNSENDPAADFYGSLYETDEPMFWRIVGGLEGLGVEVRIHEHEALGYNPSPAAGAPGQMHLWTGASYSGILHEVTHFWDDEKLGFPPLSQTLCDNKLRVSWEAHAYDAERSLALSRGNERLAEALERLKEKEAGPYVRA